MDMARCVHRNTQTDTQANTQFILDFICLFCHLTKIPLKNTFSNSLSGTVRLLMAAAFRTSCLACSVFPRSNNHLADSGMNLSM